jgi:hypothetical protein
MRQQQPGGSKAWIVGMTTEPRHGSHFEQFPPGTVYLVEFGDGLTVDMHESHLRVAQEAKAV